MLGTLEAGQWLLMALLMGSSLLSIAYLLPIPLRAFFSENGPDSGGAAPVPVREAPWPSLLAIAVTTLGCLLLLFYPNAFYQLIKVAL
jgi:multicomponent Na+:H+ antiporter subunit D